MTIASASTTPPDTFALNQHRHTRPAAQQRSLAVPTCTQLSHGAQTRGNLAQYGGDDAECRQAAGKQLVLGGEAPVGDAKEAGRAIQQGDLGVLQGPDGRLTSLRLLGLLLEGGRVGQQAGDQVEADQASQEEANLLLRTDSKAGGQDKCEEMSTAGLVCG